MIDIANDGTQIVLNLGGVAWLGGIIVFIVTTIIENAPVKFKPWSWLAKKFGRAVNAEMLEAIRVMESRVQCIEERNRKQDECYAEDKAIAARRRIISFSDRLRIGQKFSLEAFNSVLDDITYYETYCIEHKNFKNEKAKASIEIVRAAYQEAMENDDFL